MSTTQNQQALSQQDSQSTLAPQDIALTTMPSPGISHVPHAEGHAKHGTFVRDSIIGFADGLTVPFALTAGLSSLGSTKIVILGGLAELFAGSISMGLGAYLAAITEKKHYEVEERRERREVKDTPKAEEDEIYEIFEQYGISREECKGVVNGLKGNEDNWVR
jgi:vacuolar iron transporter family protein